MNLINDFFYTSWGSTPVCAIEPLRSDDFLQVLSTKDAGHFFDASAILLSVSSVNCKLLLELGPLVETLDYFSEQPAGETYTLREISALQCRLLSFLIFKGDMSQDKAIGQRIDRLRKAGVLGYDTARKLISILTLIPEKSTTNVAEVVQAIPQGEGDTYYAQAASQIDVLVEMLDGAVEATVLRERLSAVPQKLKAQKFSIGITGVMNAGKSTMLNALLGEEILGTSVVPETANLTVIKYAQSPKATVHFWGAQEWGQIEKGADVLESMQHFVKETQTHFGETLGQYVTAEGRVEEIAVEDLPSYTSAAHSAKRCNLVKSVELYSDLEFVQNGVEIVDTPGLDDPVVQREEITKTYLAECDLLCHLMNVGQSATQKDVDFIIESLLYRNVAQLLVVITRIDMVSEEELSEVIAYTKSSIQSRLQALGQGAKFETLVSRIKFIPIAGKMALLHRTGRAEEADAQGYTLARSGILQIEAYLRETLFGAEAPKAQLIIDVIHKELGSITQIQKEAYLEEQSLLTQSAAELEVTFARHQEEAAKSQEVMAEIHEEIARSAEALRAYFAVLQRMVKGKFDTLGAVLKRRITDDVRYTLRKEKRKPTAERIETMVTIGLQDGLIDLLRDYRYQFQKRMDEALEGIVRSFADFKLGEPEETQESAKAFFEKHFDAHLLSGSHTLLIAEINQAIAKSKAKDLDALDVALEACLKRALVLLEEKFWERASLVNAELIQGFEARCKRPLAQLSQESASREQMLRSALERSQQSSEATQERGDEIAQRLSVLHALEQTLEGGES